MQSDDLSVNPFIDRSLLSGHATENILFPSMRSRLPEGIQLIKIGVHS